MKGLVAEIALQGATYAYDKLYTYAIPPEMQSLAQVGCRALVPFGKGNTKKQCMVFRIKTDEIAGLKKIISFVDKTPVLSEEMLSLCEYMKENVFCTYYDAVNIMLPAGLTHKIVNFYSANEEFLPSLLSQEEKQVYDYLLKFGEREETVLLRDMGINREVVDRLLSKEAVFKNSNTKQKVGDATEKWVRLCEDAEIGKLTPKQSAVYELLLAAGEASVKEICYFTGVTAAVVNGLISKGVLQVVNKRVFRTPYRVTAGKREEISLTDEQNEAFLGMLDDYNRAEGKTALLYGVTGSGKTQVFLRLVDKVTDEGRGAIVMVPEIALTPQLVELFTSRYGDKIALFHSAMSLGQRMDEWQRIKDGKALIAIGTRSAVFAPFENLGLVIIDEEQEHTYKSEKTPRFHARELAKYRVRHHKGLLCLASATPSLESYTAAKKGRYSLYKITKRYGGATLPEVEVVDMKKELHSGNTGVISRTLYENIKETLEKGRQVILLLNRRGHNTYVSCAECGYVEACPNCSVSLTYHSANGRLMCHYCGYSKPVEKTCSVCHGEHMKFMGIGTQKAEEELKSLFPNASVLRLDADSTVSRDSYSTYFSDFANGKYDILLGTQMVAKGLDFPNVTLVGVLGADSAMYSEDFRSFERTFSLLTQVVGRAGRGKEKGKATVQTMSSDNEIISLAKTQDYDGFYEQEILTRKLMIYPPYCDICLLSAQSSSKDFAESAIKGIFAKIKELIENKYPSVKLIILGPSPAAVHKVNNRYRYRMIIKCKNNKEFRNMLKEAVEIKLSGDTSVSIDINPETVI